MLEAMKRKFENFGSESIDLKWPSSFPNHSNCQHSFEEESKEDEEDGKTSDSEESPFSKDSSSSSAEFLIEEKRNSLSSSSVLSDKSNFTLHRDIEFLKEEQRTLLTALHKEIEDLKRKNKDLQFQLLMGSDDLPIKKPEKEPPPRSSKFHQTVTELQAELKTVKSQNETLSNLLEEQRRKTRELEDEISHFKSLPRLEESSSGFRENSEAMSVSLESLRMIENQYLRRMEDAENIIYFLQKENQEQKTELMDIKAEIFRNTTLKYRGCNHPSTSRFRSYSKSRLDKLQTGIGTAKRSRTESLDRFSSLPRVKNKAKTGIFTELPPVPGSSGSDTSMSSSRLPKHQPINLVSLKPTQYGAHKKNLEKSSDNLPRFLTKKPSKARK